jgi:hypothetical protein
VLRRTCDTRLWRLGARRICLLHRAMVVVIVILEFLYMMFKLSNRLDFYALDYWTLNS